MAVRDRPLGRQGRHAEPDGLQGRDQPVLARSKTIAFQNDDRKPAPIPLENCPWCGEKFKPHSFQLVPNANAPTDLRVVCINRRCDLTRNQPLPILAVDEPIYRRLPCFLIATVDKFAAMPWTGQVGVFLVAPTATTSPISPQPRAWVEQRATQGSTDSPSTS